MSLNEKILRIITDYFKKRPGVAAVYLYGSQARGNARSESDIDLAVLTTDGSKYIGLNSPQILFSQELTKVLNKKVEVQNLITCRIDFAHRVLAEGKLLASNNEGARIKFEENVIRKYFDLKPFLSEFYKSLSIRARKGEIGARFT